MFCRNFYRALMEWNNKSIPMMSINSLWFSIVKMIFLSHSAISVEMLGGKLLENSASMMEIKSQFMVKM
jgi:hypothetical protein